MADLKRDFFSLACQNSPMSIKAHETKEECKILSTILSARMTRTNHYVRMFSLHGKPMNSSGTTAGFQAQILWSKESAALFRICLQIWILKTRAQTTDTPDNVHGEGGEEESMTNDEMVTHGSPWQFTSFAGSHACRSKHCFGWRTFQ